MKKRVALLVLALLVLTVTYIFRHEPGNSAAIRSVESGAPFIEATAAEDSVPRPGVDEEFVVSPECPDYSGPDDPRKTYGDVKNELESAIVSLQGSGSPMHWLAASILLADTESELALQMLQNLARTEATSSVATWRMLILCDQRRIAACNSPSIEELAIKADADNGMMWAQVAGRRFAVGRDEEAIEAMRRAIAARRFDTYFAEQMQALERGFAAVTGWTYPERIIYGSDSIASNPSNLVAIHEYCRRTNSIEGIELCDELGERIYVERGETSARLIGIEMRQAVLESRADDDQLAALDQDYLDLKALQSALFEDVGALNLLLNDEQVMRDFISTIDAHGEVEAALLLQERTDRLRATPGYDQCNFASNPYINMDGP